MWYGIDGPPGGLACSTFIETAVGRGDDTVGNPHRDHLFKSRAVRAYPLIEIRQPVPREDGARGVFGNPKVIIRLKVLIEQVWLALHS